MTLGTHLVVKNLTRANPLSKQRTHSEPGKKKIPFCKAEIAIERREGKYHMPDTLSQDIVQLKHARELASRLRDSNPFTFGTLGCKGIVRQQSNLSLVFV
jgi:hypothetical protein